MEQNKTEVLLDKFQGFQEWLEMNERKEPQRASAICSYLRSLTREVGDIYVEEEKIGKLFLVYGMLLDSTLLNKREQEKKIKKALSFLAHVYLELSRGKGRHKKNLADKKTSFILYVRFLSEMFDNSVTMSKIEEVAIKSRPDISREKLIWRERKSTSKVSPNERFAPKYFIKGIFKAIKAAGQVLPKDFNAVTVILNQFEKVLDAAEQVYGVKLKSPWKVTSLITTLSSQYQTEGWKLLLVNEDNLMVNDMPIFTEDVKWGSFDPVDASLLLYKDGTVQKVKLPVLSGRRSNNRELSVRVIPIESMSTLAFRLAQIRDACRTLKCEMRAYIEEMKQTKPRRVFADDNNDSDVMHYELIYPNLSEDDYITIAKGALENIDVKRVVGLGEHIYQLLVEYASGFKYELVVE